MFLSIDPEKCMGHARCYMTAADLLSPDEEGFVAQRGQTVAVPAHLQGDARDVVNACPEGAITLRAAAAADAAAADVDAADVDA